MNASYSVYKKLNLDGSIQKITMDFFEKLVEDPTSRGLRVKPISGSADPRARTARVNDYYRAVMFELNSANRKHFLIQGIYPHGQDIDAIKKSVLRVNPVNGITELIRATEPDPAVQSQDIDSLVKQRVAEQEAERLLIEQQREAQAQAGEQIDVLPRQTIVPAEALNDAGLSPEILLQELGIPEESTAIVMGLDSDEFVETALEHRPAWEADAFIGLLAGFTIAEVRESLGMAEPSDITVDAEDDEQLLEGLKSPAAQLEYAFLEGGDNDALRRVLESGNFESWRVFIHPDQRDIVERDFSGSGRIFGGAGTGKTVVAVHRANRLAGEVNADGEHPRVLLTTYTRVLADSLKSHMDALNPVYPNATYAGAPGLWISGIDQLVVSVVREASRSDRAQATRSVLGIPMRKVRPLTARIEDQLWADAIAFDEAGLDSSICNQTFLSQEFESVVLANGITEEREYLRVARSGRGTPLNRTDRKAIWAIFEKFIRGMAAEGQVTWQAHAAIGAELLKNRFEATGERMFDHVLIDEAQDFHAGHWRFLRQLVSEGPNDVFLAEDAHQRIYGQPYVLSRFGISTRGRASKRLTLNYRTTRETLDYAVRILDGTWIDAEGEEDSTRGYRSARSGPTPVLRRFESELDEIEGVAELISGLLEDDPGARIGVFARTVALVRRATNGLNKHGLVVGTPSRGTTSNAPVQVMTMHSAKGMEFTHVVLIGVGSDVLPQEWQHHGLAEAEREGALQRERALLYVAASRARDQLIITTHGDPSELLPRS